MSVKRTARSAKFKFQVALEAAKEQHTLNQLASQYELNPGQVSQSPKGRRSALETPVAQRRATLVQDGDGDRRREGRGGTRS